MEKLKTLPLIVKQTIILAITAFLFIIGILLVFSEQSAYISIPIYFLCKIGGMFVLAIGYSFFKGFTGVD